MKAETHQSINRTGTHQSINRTGVMLLSAAMLALASCSSPPKPPPPAGGAFAIAYAESEPGGVFANTMDVSAKVMHINREKRKVTLLGPDGKEYTAEVESNAVDLDRIKKGDMIEATLTEELVVDFGGDDVSGGDGAAATVAVVPKGESPGAVGAVTSQTTGTVTAIDAQNHTGTLRFEDGSTKVFPVRSGVELNESMIGESVVFQVTRVITLRVENP